MTVAVVVGDPETVSGLEQAADGTQAITRTRVSRDKLFARAHLPDLWPGIVVRTQPLAIEFPPG